MPHATRPQLPTRPAAAAAAALLALAAAGFAPPAAAAQAPAVFDNCSSNVNGIPGSPEPRSCAWVQAFGQGTTRAAIVNGRPADALNIGQLGGVYGTRSSPDGWSNGATATSDNGSVASATADLHTGTLRSTLSSSLPLFAHGAYSNSRIVDQVTFHNASGQAAVLDFGFTIDGRFDPGPNGYDGSASNRVTLLFASPDDSIVTAGSGSSIGRAMFAGGAFTVLDQYGGYVINTGTTGQPGDYRFTAALDTATGSVGGGYSIGLRLPTGDSTLQFSLTMDIICNAAGGLCDFGHTGALSFGTLPAGVSFDSASGVLFTPAVPEPGPAALWLAGLAGLGRVARRRPHG